MNIITNHRKRELLYKFDVPEKVLVGQFDYLDEYTDDGFIHYRKCWYLLCDFMRIDNNSPLALLGFDGYHGDSYFSGVLIKICDYDESVIMATYHT